MKLRNQILTALFLSGLLPLAIAFIYAIWHSSAITHELTLDAAEKRLEVVAEKLSGYFDARRAEIEIISRTSIVQSMEFSQMRPYLLQTLHDNKEHYEKFIIGRNDGSFHNTSGGNPHVSMLRTFNDSSPDAKPKSIKKRDYWQYTVGNIKNNQSRSYISNPMISYTTEVKQIVVASTITDKDGKPQGLIGGSLPWKNIQNIIYKLNNTLEEEFSGLAQLAMISKDGTYWYHWNAKKTIHLKKDDNGNFILGPNGEKTTVSSNIKDSEISLLKESANNILQGKKTLITLLDNDSKVHNIFIPVPSSGYILQLAVPDSVLSAPTSNLKKLLITVFIVSSVIAIIITIVISKSMTSPLLNFTKSLDNLKEGNLKPIELSSHTSEFNHLFHAFNSMINIIKERERSLSNSEERFSLAMQGANDGLWDWNMITNAVYYSPRWKHMLGYESDELEDTLETWKKLVHPDDLQLCLDAVNDYVEEKTQSYRLEIRMNHKNGSFVNVLTRGFLIRDESTREPIRMVGTHIDITDRKKQEIELKALNNNLEQRVKERTLELELLNNELLSAKDIAESANKAKSNFLANMSHEIRTPMNGIIGLTELTLRTDIDNKQREYLEQVKISADILLHILNDILDFSKIEAGKLTLEATSFDFDNIIHNVISIFTLKAQEKNISLNLEIANDIPETLLGDPVRLTQILANLISNAIKFTNKGSITLRISRSDQIGFLNFNIIDTGIGIPLEIQNKLFNSFTQADSSTSRKYGGTGLGLSICKHLVELMKGNITLISAPDEGSSFNFSLYLPADKVAISSRSKNNNNNQVESDTDDYLSTELFAKKVLLVEDVLVNQLIAKELLSQAGMQVDTADNGKQAVEMAKLKTYELIIMDIQMPEMDGFEATMLIRSLDHYSDIPIIALTANAMKTDELQCIESGMNGHISKPIDTDNFISNIEKYI